MCDCKSPVVTAEIDRSILIDRLRMVIEHYTSQVEKEKAAEAARAAQQREDAIERYMARRFFKMSRAKAEARYDRDLAESRWWSYGYASPNQKRLGRAQSILKTVMDDDLFAVRLPENDIRLLTISE